MSKAVKIVLVVIVLGLGAAGAWRFRKSPDPGASLRSLLSDRPNLRKPGSRNAGWKGKGWVHAPPRRSQTPPPLARIAVPEGFADSALPSPPMPLPHPSGPRHVVPAPPTGNDCREASVRQEPSPGLDDGGWRSIKTSGRR